MENRLRERIHRFNEGDETQRREINEIEVRHKDGRSIPVEVVSTLVCDEHNVPRTVIGVSRDISARRAAQEEQKRFVAMVSHEFRTPLATIDGAVQRLQASTQHVDAPTRHRYDKIQKAVDRLTALLDDYLTQERIDIAGKGLHLSDASPLALLHDSAASARALSAEHRITIEAPDLPSTFRCDIDRMRLTLRVLADNAVKYTPPGSCVMLQASASHNGIEFVVADNGDGIPDNELPYVFDKFFRGRRAEQQTGSGLGLHMARRVVEMHGGTLTAHNRSTGGAQFRIWLPTEFHPTPMAVAV
jgi:signal transduction histidine kinase